MGSDENGHGGGPALSAATRQGQQEQNHVVFLENFFDELRRRVPTRKLTDDRSNQFKLWRSGEARCGGMSVVYKAKDLKLGRHVLNAGLRLPGAA